MSTVVCPICGAEMSSRGFMFHLASRHPWIRPLLPGRSFRKRFRVDLEGLLHFISEHVDFYQCKCVCRRCIPFRYFDSFPALLWHMRQVHGVVPFPRKLAVVVWV